jgi:hypothetical protein
MAFEADCGSSTVLLALCVATTVGFFLPGEGGGPRDEALRDSVTPTGVSRRRIEDGGRQIRNSKFEIRNLAWVGGIPNS